MPAPAPARARCPRPAQGAGSCVGVAKAGLRPAIPPPDTSQTPTVPVLRLVSLVPLCRIPSLAAHVRLPAWQTQDAVRFLHLYVLRGLVSTPVRR